MANILKTGLIPISAPIKYKENYRLNDTNVGSFISLDGYRKFFNPGIGLSLASPSSDPVTSSSILNNNTSQDNLGTLLENFPGAAGVAFIFYLNTTNPVGDPIAGFVNRTASINNIKQFGLVGINSIISDGSVRILNVLQDASYTFTFSATGNVQMSTNSAFNMEFGFYMNINGTETLMMPNTVGVNSVFVGGDVSNRSTYTFNFPTFTKTVNLRVGDYVQIYGKGIGAKPRMSVAAILDTTQLIKTKSITTAPTQTTFTNPLDITDFKTSSINYYGSNRDTLMIVGNKLTS